MNDPIAVEPNRVPADRVSHLFLLLAILAVAAFFLWAWQGEIDVVSRAQGVVAPAGQVKRVQHLEGGIVSEIAVQEGDRVEAGSLLVRLDGTRNWAEVAELEQRTEGLEVKLTRLRAEVDGQPKLEYSESLRTKQPTLVREGLILFKARQLRLANQLQVQQQIIIQNRYKQEEIHSRLRANAAVNEFLQEQIKISDKLLQSSLSNRMTHIDLLKERGRSQGQRAEDEAALKQTEAALKEAQQQMELVQSTFREEAQAELDEALDNLNILTERLKKERDGLQRTEIRAPVAGTVKTLYVATLGGVIAPGGMVADLVPSGDPLLIEAQLPPGDISFVLPGQPTLIRLASADGFRFKVIHGVVQQVSPDTLVTEEGKPYYKIRITTEQRYFEKGSQHYPFFPGMPVECTILTGMRTVLEYLLEPFMGVATDALRER